MFGDVTIIVNGAAPEFGEPKCTWLERPVYSRLPPDFNSIIIDELWGVLDLLPKLATVAGVAPAFSYFRHAGTAEQEKCYDLVDMSARELFCKAHTLQKAGVPYKGHFHNDGWNRPVTLLRCRTLRGGLQEALSVYQSNL